MDDQLQSSFLSYSDSLSEDIESLPGSQQMAGVKHDSSNGVHEGDHKSFQPEELILTGNAFDHLKINDPRLLGRILFDIRIFARFSPEQKAEVRRHVPSPNWLATRQLTRNFQLVNLVNRTGLVTGMCGDGGNDCGALRYARVAHSFHHQQRTDRCGHA